MKISKLFHWLYACLMLLPIFAIGVTCAYVTFNKNAYQSYSGTTAENETYEHYEWNDMKIGKTYYTFTNSPLTTSVHGSSSKIYVSNFENYGYILTQSTVDFLLSEVDSITIWTPSSGNNYLMSFEFHKTGSAGYYYTNSTGSFNFSYTFEGFQVINLTTLDLYNDFLYVMNYVERSYMDNVFYYSVDKVTQSSMFSWAYDSFLVAPFSYIVSLFGVPSTHVMVELMSYWLSVSIIWLVFDLIMYVPLLVHRWLDKGVLE